MIGPLVATLVAAQFGNMAMLWTIAFIQVFGSIWLLLNKSVAQAKIPLSKTAVGRVLKNPAVTAVTFLGLLFVGSFAGVEVGAVALFEKSVAGVMFAVFSIGSLLGGFLLAPRVKSRRALPCKQTKIFSCGLWWNSSTTGFIRPATWLGDSPPGGAASTRPLRQSCTNCR